MKPNYFFLVIIISLFIFTGCTSQNSNPEQAETEDKNISKTSTNQQKSTTLNEVLTAVENASGLSNPLEMRLRRKVDDLSLSDEGEGFTLRLSSDDSKFSENTEIINQTLKNLGFTITESIPQNPQSFVVKFIKYEKSNLKCTLEIRKIGSTGESELSFGCI